MANGLADKSDDLSSVPGTYMVEGEDLLLQVAMHVSNPNTCIEHVCNL